MSTILIIILGVLIAAALFSVVYAMLYVAKRYDQDAEEWENQHTCPRCDGAGCVRCGESGSVLK